MIRKKLNKKQIILLGVLIGMLIIFAFPIFPVPLNNKEGVFSGFMFISGLMQLGLSLKSFAFLELLGGTLGFAFTFFYMEAKNKWSNK